jgi:PKD repeat protein
MYLATGDGNGYSSQLSTASVGVWISNDGGQTWNTNTGLNWTVQSGRVIYKLLINPNNTQMIFAATSIGIYRTLNGGANWSAVTASAFFTDIEFKPGNTNVVYAVSGRLNNGTCYRSTDGGATFTVISSGLPSSASVGRLELGVTPADTSLVYLVAMKANTYDFYGFYASTDGGSTFSQRSNTPNILTGPAGAQAWYNLAMAVSPTDKNKVLVGATNIWKSINGGTSWTINADGSNSQAPFAHPDQHALRFINGNDSMYFAGNDGGLWRTNNNGASWSCVNTGLEIAQLYKLGSYVQDPYEIITGHQDMGHHILQGSNWSLLQVGTGDGMEAIYSYRNDSIFFLEGNYGWLIRTVNHGQGYILSANYNSTGVNGLGSWITPVVMHPTNDSILLIGKDYVYKSTQMGAAGSWVQQGATTGGSGYISALAFAPSSPSCIYAAKFNRMFVSLNGGTTFSDITGTLPVAQAQIVGIAVSNTDPQKVWVCFSGYSAGNKVFYSSNGGTTWSNYSTGLPNLPVNCILYHNNSNDALYIGMDIGVYFISNSLGAWQPYFNGLPNVDVEELEIACSVNKIRAATNGRALWESDLALPSASFSTAPVCANTSCTFTDASTGSPTSWSWSFPGGVPSSSTLQNPTATYAAAGTYTVTLFAYNANGYTSYSSAIVVNPLPAVPTITQNGYQLTSSPAAAYQWYFNSVLIPGATQQTYTALQDGDYSVVVTDANGCTNVSALLNVTGTGMSDPGAAGPFVLMPNPSDGKFSIRASGEKVQSIRIFNAVGQVIFQREMPAPEIDISSQPRGIYVAEISAGNSVYRVRLVVQ